MALVDGWWSNDFTLTGYINIDYDYEMQEVSFVLVTRHRQDALESFVKSLGNLNKNATTGYLLPSEALSEFLRVVEERVGWEFLDVLYRVNCDGWVVMDDSRPENWEFEVDGNEAALNMDLPHFDAFFAMLPCGPMTKSAAKQ